VALQQNPDCLSPDFGHQFAFHGFFGNQPDRPARLTFRRSTANHSHDALLVRGIKNLLRTWPLLVIKGSWQAPIVVAMGNLPNRLRSKRNDLSDSRCGHPAAKLLKSQGAEDNADLLDATAQQLTDLTEVLSLDLNRDWATCHALVCNKTFGHKNGLIERFQAVGDLVRVSSR
jgi:hypothetical protein